jgi:hypothetical protein
MSRRKWLGVVSAASASLAVGLVAGCQESTEVPLAKGTPGQVGEVKRAEDLPKEQRPAQGGSSGMNYPPGGRPPMTGGIPKAAR